MKRHHVLNRLTELGDFLRGHASVLGMSVCLGAGNMFMAGNSAAQPATTVPPSVVAPSVMPAGAAEAASATALTRGTLIDVGDDAAGLDFSKDGTRLYVTSSTNNSLAVIDTGTRCIVRTITDKLVVNKNDGCPDNTCRGVGAVSVAVDGAGKFAYVTSMRTDALAFVNLESGAVERAVKVQRYPLSVMLAPDERRAYLVNLVSNSISVIDLAAGKAIGKPIALEGGDASYMPFGRPLGTALSADGAKLFVTNGMTQTIDIFDTATLKQTGTIEPGEGALDLRLDAHTGNLFALMSDGVIEYDTQTLAPRAAMHFCARTRTFAFTLSPDGNELALSLAESGVAVTVDRKSGLVRGAYETGEWPGELRYAPDGSSLAALSKGNVVLFDARDHGGAAAYVAKYGELFCKPDIEQTSP